MVRIIVEGWLLGLATGPYCLGACAPFMVPYLFAEGRAGWRGNLRIIGEFLLGRLLAYLLFGAAVGWVGGLLQPHVSRQVAQWALGVTALMMLSYALIKTLPQWRCCAWIAPRVAQLHVPMLLGFLIGLNLCPPFLVAVARLLQLGQVAGGVLFFLGFFVGTTLYTLPLVSLSPLTRHARFQHIGTLAALLVGGYFLLTALLGVSSP